MPYSIMIDAGHGGNDPGAVYKGRREKDDNFALWDHMITRWFPV